MGQILKNKISEAMKRPFVGSYIFSKEELSLIYDDVGALLRNIAVERGETLSSIYYDETFVAIVNLAKEWAPEENRFFEFIFRRLLGSCGINQKLYNQITNAIDNLNRMDKVFLFKSFKKKYYTTICSHAFAPFSSTEAFFDIYWEIYNKKTKSR